MTGVAWVLLGIVFLEAVLLAIVMSVLHRLSLFVDDVFWYRAPTHLPRVPVLSLLRPLWLDRIGGFVARRWKRWRSGFRQRTLRPVALKSD
jgi:G:T-mismatch repair DNA endonuclease (very short patch repair protein)